MISAIFEILALLTVSCLIGIYFTYRYWKAKYQALIDELDILKQALKDAMSSADSDKKSVEMKEEELKKALEEIEQLRSNKKTSSSKSKSTTDKDKIKSLKSTLELKEEQLHEKEREIEMLSIELKKAKIPYYKQIDGKRYKAITLQMADESVEGKGDGRISKEDAEKIFATISDGKAYTQVEKDTLKYIRDHYKWTDGGDDLFRKKVRSWAAKGHILEEHQN